MGLGRSLLGLLGIAVVGGGVWITSASLGYHAPPPAKPADIAITDHRFEAISRALTDALEAHRVAEGLPALSAAIGVDGKLAWAASTGWADVEAGVAVRRNHKFRIGSTSKAVTSTALARMVDDQRIDLDTAIDTHLDPLPNVDWAPMTPRQLAAHTAGLPGYSENTDYRGFWHTLTLWRQYDTVRESLDVFDTSDLLFTPGFGFHYSSFDVNLLSAVMEAADGRPYLELIDARVLTPLGMTRTHADYADRAVEDRVVFYERDGAGVKPWREVNLSVKWASGGLVSTSSDLVTMGLAWLDDGFIKPATRDDFWTPVPLADGSANPQHYAVGWRADTTSLCADGCEYRRAHHGGVSKGAQSWLVVYRDLGLVIAVNTNARTEVFGDFPRVEKRLAEIVLKATQQRLTGTDGAAKSQRAGAGRCRAGRARPWLVQSRGD